MCKNIKLLVYFILLMSLLVGTTFADLNDGLIAYYPFNGNANDESGNNLHCTINGATEQLAQSELRIESRRLAGWRQFCDLVN
ncbi:conserved hypothetical protein, secreted [Candidatus Magnetomorum sp. HK-1]|nr:conserved hypothetical protein, secreted [Candidatus Magnetomorum sp. HK-1]